MSDNQDKPGLIERRPVHKGRIVDLSIDSVRFPNGKTGEIEMIRHSGASAVLPILSDPNSDDPQILMVRQYRYASGGYLLEIPAGRPDKEGEDWEVCARRELEEETGMIAGKMEKLTTIFTTPGFCDEQIHLFLATELTQGKESHDADEFLNTEVMLLSDALMKIRDGEITDAKTICTILFAAGFLLGA